MIDPDSRPSDSFEQQLARALRRIEVPAETARKLHALTVEAAPATIGKGAGLRLPAQPRSGGARVLAFPRLGTHFRSWAAGALAAVLLLSVAAGGVHVEHRREARRTAEAQRQFDTAERIEDQTMQQVRRQMEQAGVPVD